MGKFKDLTNKKLGRLTVIGRDGYAKNRGIMWKCICDCGNTTMVHGDSLNRGLTKSCGCIQKEYATNNIKHGYSRRTGIHRTYSSWQHMLSRCINENSNNYSDYGGRGITVCDEWLDFANFLADMGECKGKLTLDRIDVDKGYNKDNCQWATMLHQENNKRNNRLIEFNGKTLTMAQWARDVGIKSNTLFSRLKSGWTVERALTEKTKERAI